MIDDNPIKNYIVEDHILDMENNLYRKYFGWRVLKIVLETKGILRLGLITDYYFKLHQETNPIPIQSKFEIVQLNLTIVLELSKNIPDISEANI